MGTKDIYTARASLGVDEFGESPSVMSEPVVTPAVNTDPAAVTPALPAVVATPIHSAVPAPPAARAPVRCCINHDTSLGIVHLNFIWAVCRISLPPSFASLSVRSLTSVLSPHCTPGGDADIGDADIGDAAGLGAVTVGARSSRGCGGARCPAAVVVLVQAAVKIGRRHGELPVQVRASVGSVGGRGVIVAEAAAKTMSFSLWQVGAGLPDLPRRTSAESGTWLQWVERKLKVAKQQLSEKFGGAEGTKDEVRSRLIRLNPVFARGSSRLLA